VVAPERIAITIEFAECETMERKPSGIKVEVGEAVVIPENLIGATSANATVPPEGKLT